MSPMSRDAQKTMPGKADHYAELTLKPKISPFAQVQFLEDVFFP